MKKLLLLSTFVLFFSFAHAADWQETWIGAVKNCREKNYSQAENFFNQLIDQMERAGDSEHAHIYVDRARLHMALQRYKAALPDLDKALQSPHLVGKDRVRAVVSRTMTRAQLGMAEGVIEDMASFRELNSNGPTVEMCSKFIVIRNVPDCKCYLNLVKTLSVEAGICKSEKEVQLLPSNIFVIARKPNTSFELGQEADCVAAALWGSQTFVRLNCQMGCLMAIDFLREVCLWSSQNDPVSIVRTNPFEKMAAYKGKPCEPFWE